MNINSAIEEILDHRRKRLPRIEDAIKNMRMVSEKIDSIDILKRAIGQDAATGNGQYSAMLLSDPSIKLRLDAIDTQQIKVAIAKQQERLNLLKKRFSREAVQIAFVGYERQGKSRILQSITGLNNNVIPAYSGTSCTGAVSVIHNSTEPLRAHIQFYSETEFLEIVREKYKTFFPDRPANIHCIDDIANLDISNFRTDDNMLSTEFGRFKNNYIEHISEYRCLLTGEERDFSEEHEIIKHVSQYEEFDVVPEAEDAREYIPMEKGGYKRPYYYYIAVKKVDIFTHFPTLDDAKIILCDTIGIGTTTDTQRVELEMFRVLREDCDAAVDVYRPENIGGLIKEQKAILNKIATNLKGRNPEKWLMYVINKCATGKFYNCDNIPDVLKQIHESFEYSPSPVADIVVVDAANDEDVLSLLLQPLLNLISNNLDDIDNSMMHEVIEAGASLHQHYCSIVASMQKVLTAGAKGNANITNEFNRLYSDGTSSLMQTVKRAIGKLLDQYNSIKNNPCDAVADKIKEVQSRLTNLTPTIGEIELLVASDEVKAVIFSQCLDVYRNKVYKEFEKVCLDVLLPLQNQVKDEITAILFIEGRMGSIPLKAHETKREPTQQWLRCLIDEKVSQEEYPELNEILNYVLDFRFNIEGQMEYKVFQSVAPIDTDNNPALESAINSAATRQEMAEVIWGDIKNRATKVQKAIGDWCNEFALIPSACRFTRVQKFRDKWSRGDDATNRCIREFYSNNCMTIWRDEFLAIATRDQAMSGFSALCEQLDEYCNKKYFTI